MIERRRTVQVSPVRSARAVTPGLAARITGMNAFDRAGSDPAQRSCPTVTSLSASHSGAGEVTRPKSSGPSLTQCLAGGSAGGAPPAAQSDDSHGHGRSTAGERVTVVDRDLRAWSRSGPPVTVVALTGQAGLDA